jgi:hypothetical protein
MHHFTKLATLKTNSSMVKDCCAGNGLYLSITMNVAGCGVHIVPGHRVPGSKDR